MCVVGDFDVVKVVLVVDFGWIVCVGGVLKLLLFVVVMYLWFG